MGLDSYILLTRVVIIFLIIALKSEIGSASSRNIRVVNGKIVSDGLYIIQSEHDSRVVLSVGGEDFGKTKLAGESLNSVISTKWNNYETQKWTVSVMGKKYFHLIPNARQRNSVTYKIYMADFPMPNIWEILPVDSGKYWQIKKHRGKCLQYKGMDKLVTEGKCDSKNTKQLWHFHMLTTTSFKISK